MKLTSFRAEGIHGYLPFDIKFHPDLSFLTGINGCGKTTAINSIVALLTPDFHFLSNLAFRSMEVALEHEGEKYSICASGSDNDFSISVSGVKEHLRLQRFSIDNDIPTSRAADHEAEHFRDLTVQFASHPVMRLLERLPTPMFLGLDRRARLGFGTDNRRGYLWKTPRSILPSSRSSLSRSLLDAAELAAINNRNALISAGRIAEDLQRDLLLSLLTVSAQDIGGISAPTGEEISELARIKRDLETFPEIFRLPREEVRNRVSPFLEAMQKSVKAIPRGTNAQTAIAQRNVDNGLVVELVKWTTNRPQLKRIRVISDVVERYNEQRAALLRPINRYADLVNQFLKDSGKTIGFDDDGFVHVRVEGIEGNREITSLSSGEAQIFVILSHLSFSQNAKTANVFIIDEPEISLHVLWQEIFVDSVQAANPNIQYIMATHAPSIILDRTKKCIDLSRVKKSPRGTKL